ncbi:hypothetical protein CRENPOLYSF2_3370004 [Crenothrix polyspora]|uniref:Uncharacterized protein n=1 Tax=Crenothrix polyspora TaxID=360316 RepID=A0A1R4HBU7_9GAMM|nr:hypothetical protein CRENPOLYSF2_3370004 [Crenothrix polyspora]
MPRVGIARLHFRATHLRRDTVQGLTVRPELVEGWAVKPIMVRQAHHERLNLKLSRLKWVAHFVFACATNKTLVAIVLCGTTDRFWLGASSES